MKIFAFVDWHAELTAYKRMLERIEIDKPDVIICAGDFTVFEQNIEACLDKISKMGKTVFILHGNHETEEVVGALCKRYDNMIFLHKKIVELGGFTFVGFGGGGFAMVDKEFEKWSETIKDKIKDKKIILVTHAPFYKTKLDNIYGNHNGNKSFSKFIQANNNVILGICGHFHETAKKTDKLNNAELVNPGKDGMLIEVGSG